MSHYVLIIHSLIFIFGLCNISCSICCLIAGQGRPLISITVPAEPELRERRSSPNRDLIGSSRSYFNKLFREKFGLVWGNLVVQDSTSGSLVPFCSLNILGRFPAWNYSCGHAFTSIMETREFALLCFGSSHEITLQSNFNHKHLQINLTACLL